MHGELIAHLTLQRSAIILSPLASIARNPAHNSFNQMRETPTYAHLISCYLTDGRSILFLRQKARAQKARKLGLLGLSASFLLVTGGFHGEVRIDGSGTGDAFTFGHLAGEKMAEAVLG